MAGSIMSKVTSNNQNQTDIDNDEVYTTEALSWLDKAEKFAVECREYEAKAKACTAHTSYVHFLRKNAEIKKMFFMIMTNNAQLMTHEATTWKLSQKINIYNETLLKEAVDKSQTYHEMAQIYESLAQINEDMAQICDANDQTCQAIIKAYDELSQVFEARAKSKDELINVRDYKLASSQSKLLCQRNAELASDYQSEASRYRKDASLHRNNIDQCRIKASRLRSKSLLREICDVLGPLILLILTFYFLPFY